MSVANTEKNRSMSLDMIKSHKPEVIGINDCLQAAVCIPIIKETSGPAILFEKRSSAIPHQPGDICFPGGVIEAGETPMEAALRETSEELLIPCENITILGVSDYIHMEHLAVYPFAAELKEYIGTFSLDEVAEIFTIPLSWFVKNGPESYTVESIISPPSDFPYERIEGGRNYKWRNRSEKVYFYQYGDYTIWGLTAKILKSFIELCCNK